MPAPQPQIQFVPVCCCQPMSHPCSQGIQVGMQYGPSFTGHMHGYGGYEMPNHHLPQHTQENFQPAPFGPMYHDYPSPCMEMPESPVYHPPYENDCGCSEPDYPMGFPNPPHGMNDMQQVYQPSCPDFHTQEQPNHLYPQYTDEGAPQYPTPPSYPDFFGYNKREETDGTEGE